MGKKKRFKIISLAMTFFMIAVTVMGNIGVAYAKGTTDDPYTIAEALNYVQTTFAASNASGEVTVEGYIVGISSIATPNGLILADDASIDILTAGNTKLLHILPHSSTVQNTDMLNIWRDISNIGKKVKVTGTWRGKAQAKYGGVSGYSTIGTVSGKDITITASGAAPEEPVELTGLSLTQSLEVEVAKTSKLSETYEPTNTTEKEVIWTSSDDAIAAVTQDGTVTGIAEGQATITVTSKIHSDIKAECAVTVVKAVPVILTTIAEARTKTPGETVKVQGTVSRIVGSNIFIQDATAGILVYKSGLNVAEGDLIEVIGSLKDYNGLLEIVDSADKTVIVTATVLSSGNIITPKVVKINEVNETVESQLVIVEGAKFGAINNTGNTPLTDATGSLNIYKLPTLTDIVEGEVVDVTCLVGEFKGTYQLTVAKASDVTKIDLGPDTSKPVITHTAITEANINSDLTVRAVVIDDRKVESVKLYYKTKGQEAFKTLDMVNALGNYSVTVTKENLDMLGFEYYIEAFDGANTETTTIYNVNVVNTDIFGPIITKLEPAADAILDKTNTKPGIRVEFNDPSGIATDSVSLVVDGVDITSSATVKDDSVSYAMDTELSQGKHSVTVKVSDAKGNETTRTWSFTIGQVEYNTYFGELHSHTGEISDGTGTLDDAYTWARDKAKVDFYAVTDHSNWFDNDTKGSLLNADGTENDCVESTKWTKSKQAADKYNKDGEFVAMAGFEMTWSGSTGGWGHINTFNTKGFETRSNGKMDLKTYYDQISKIPSSTSQLNHPGKTFGDFGDFGFYTKAADQVVNLIEVGNGEGPVRGSGYFPSYEYYTRALDKGWHVAPTNNEDNHKGGWGTSNTARTVILAPTLSREAIYEAMTNKRVYSTEDENLEIMYKVNGQVMGANLNNPEKLNFLIDIKDIDTTDKIGKISIIANGGTVVTSKTFDSNNAYWEFELEPQYDYYYVRVDQADKDIAVTAPVWTGEVAPVGISSVEVSQNPQVLNTPVDVTASVYNNGTTALSNVNVEFFKNTIAPENKIGEQNIVSIPSASIQNAKITWTPNDSGTITIIAQTTIAIDGKSSIFTEKTTIDVAKAEDLVKIVIDGGHRNFYVSGSYAGKMVTLTALFREKKIMLVENKDELTAEDLVNTKVLIITDPLSKTEGGLEKSNFTTAEIAVVKNFVDNGGSLILTSRSDQDESNDEYQSSIQANSILEAIGTNLRINDDTLVDDVKNGGTNYRLYFDKYTSSKYHLTSNVPASQTFSSYRGCSVILKENGSDASVDWLVKGHTTTGTLDADKAGDNKAVDMGNAYVLAVEQLASGGKVVVAGSTFFSDFETAAVDNAYSNKTIMENIINWMTIPQKSIGEVRIDANKDGIPDNFGKKFTIEGIVTAQSEAVTPKNAFFEVIYVQDATGGITVFGVSSTAVKLGQKVRITGVVDGYQGDAEIMITNETKDLIVIDEAINLVEPKLISTKDSMLEETEGLLVKIEGLVTRIQGQNIYVNDGTGEARAYVEGYIGDSNGNNKGVWDPSIKVGDSVSIVGLASEDPEGHRLRVRNTSEIVKSGQSQALVIERLSSHSEFNVGKTYDIAIKATNNLTETKKVTLIIAQYDKNGKLLDYVKQEEDINSGVAKELQGNFTVKPNAAYVKYFVWDSIKGMKPYIDSVKILVK